MQELLQIQFSNISRSHNETINAIKRLKKEIDKSHVGFEGKTELENQLLFWDRMRYVQRDQISEIIHEAVRRKINIEISEEKEVIALIDFYSQRNLTGHKIICISPNLIRTQLVNKFLSAYCSENSYMMKSIMYEILS